MNNSFTHARWRLDEKALFLNGFGFGSRYPVTVVSVSGYALTEKQLESLSGLMSDALPAFNNNLQISAPEAGDPFRVSLKWIIDTVHQLQKIAEQAVYEYGRILSLDRERSKFFIPVTPASRKLLLDLLLVILELMNSQLQEKSPQIQLKRVAQVIADLQKNSSQGSNVKFFMQAAFEMGMPFKELPGQMVQYGLGKRGRWMSSTFSDETPVIAAIMARNKPLGAAILRKAGIPVPSHKMASNADKALKIAEEFGYPVVVKPADRDGGVGVAAGLQNREELVTAFKSALKCSNNILVEKHVDGKDYRITVFQDEVISAVERVPGGVTGDGRHTLRELVEQLNADPRRGTDRHAQLKQLAWNNEAIALLKQHGLERSSVPEAGKFIRLRRTANLASGGTPTGVFDQIHPDNQRLAIRAAQALRLDIAGIDLLMPDISRSWRETGAFICEVNGQPSLGGQTMGGKLYAPMLQKLVPDNGRIPIALVLGIPSSGTLVHDLEAQLLQKGVVAGCHDTAGVRINGEIIHDGNIDPFAAGEMLTMSRSVEAIVLNISNGRVLLTGLPVARFDLLVLVGPHMTASDTAGEPNPEKLKRELLELILPGCDGKVVTIDDRDSYKHLTPAGWEQVIAPGQAVEKITSVMLGISRHGVK